METKIKHFKLHRSVRSNLLLIGQPNQTACIVNLTSDKPQTKDLG